MTPFIYLDTKDNLEENSIDDEEPRDVDDKATVLALMSRARFADCVIPTLSLEILSK